MSWSPFLKALVIQNPKQAPNLMRSYDFYQGVTTGSRIVLTNCRKTCSERITLHCANCKFNIGYSSENYNNLKAIQDALDGKQEDILIW